MPNFSVTEDHDQVELHLRCDVEGDFLKDVVGLEHYLIKPRVIGKTSLPPSYFLNTHRYLLPSYPRPDCRRLAIAYSRPDILERYVEAIASSSRQNDNLLSHSSFGPNGPESTLSRLEYLRSAMSQRSRLFEVEGSDRDRDSKVAILLQYNDKRDYFCFLDNNRFLVETDAHFGASGSPLFLISQDLGDSQLHGMFLRGYPKKKAEGPDFQIKQAVYVVGCHEQPVQDMEVDAEFGCIGWPVA